ncbi:hypothetical protein PMAYCL1PPCAC_12516, partial [Pristionchus mayeri]
YSLNSTDISLDIVKILPPPSIDPIEMRVDVHVDRVSLSSPSFLDLPLSIDISESTVTGTQVAQLRAISTNGEVLFSLEDDEERLEVNGESGMITLRETLDYETTTHFQILVAVSDSIDESKKTTEILRVNVKGSNEFAPSFACSSSSLHLSLSLSHSPLHPLTSLTATDGDRGMDGDVSYFLLDPPPSYSIHHRKGQIVIHQIPSEERIDVLRVSAVDGGGRGSERNQSLSIHWRRGEGGKLNEDEDFIQVQEKDIRVGETIKKYGKIDESWILSMEAPFLSLSPNGEISFSSLPPPSVLKLSYRILAKSNESMATICGTLKINRLPSPPSSDTQRGRLG